MRTVFYHVAEMGHWWEIATEQIRIISASGFAKELQTVHCGTPHGADFLRRIGERYGVKINLIGSGCIQEFEFPTIIAMHKACQGGLSGNVYYLHTKGVSAPGCWVRTLWRWLMNAAMLADGGSRADAILATRDWTGPVIWDDPRFCHSSGNYFGARAEYIARLPELSDFRAGFLERYKVIVPFGCTERHAAEMWIGAGNGTFADLTTEWAVPGWGVSSWDWWYTRRDVQDFAMAKGS